LELSIGFDILNPVQTSAAGMDPQTLYRRWRITADNKINKEITFFSCEKRRFSQLKKVEPLRVYD